MEACRALGRRPEQKAVQLLAATAGKASDQDVKHSALAALGNHKGRMSVDSLRIALSDRDPATRDLAMNSLRQATGKNFGDSPDAWLKAIKPFSASPNTPVLPGAPPQAGGNIQIATSQDAKGSSPFTLPGKPVGASVRPTSAPINSSSGSTSKTPLFR